MTATLISNMNPYTWGQQTNQAVGRIVSLNTTLARLQEAVATASSGWDGIAGTQFEIGNTQTGTGVAPAASMPLNQNLFGVQADPANPGVKGMDYSYAIGQLWIAWQAFWTAAQPYIEQLDNGVVTM